jgi:hypothetical protein
MIFLKQANCDGGHLRVPIWIFQAGSSLKKGYLWPPTLISLETTKSKEQGIEK